MINEPLRFSGESLVDNFSIQGNSQDLSAFAGVVEVIGPDRVGRASETIVGTHPEDTVVASPFDGAGGDPQALGELGGRDPLRVL